MKLFDVTHSALYQAIGAAGSRQQVLANNLANVNTPGFKRTDVSFEEELQKALAAGDGSHDTARVDGIAPHLFQTNNTVMRSDGNNVDVDMEMANLAENQVRYNALVQVATSKLQLLSSVARDGR